MVTPTSRALPFAANSSTPSARGPLLDWGRLANWPTAGSKVAQQNNTKMTAHASLRYNRKLSPLREVPMEINDKAPEFSSLDQNGEKIALKDYKGKWVVLYFYPRADTPGCTIEACSFRDSLREWSDLARLCWASHRILLRRRRNLWTNTICHSRSLLMPTRQSATPMEWFRKRICTARK